ncbi:hypothetical protein PDESU_03845 [Pontiella desulfatans]|uniref:Uncharacterized protein n=1 Tax=Pontiella desulfatans TaxID=2750659 RepID=A0A6C2U5U8_PONDE|nr:hypothetical protein [Pontiella desulfatans]VGO15263.1 hypothetical protein PDESU_03845 [Pontiella desulfatans]
MNKKRALNLVDMDVGLFVSYQLTAESLTTKLFRIITLNSIPLNKVMDLREADAEDVTKLNHLNWFSFLPSRRKLCPVYTLQAAENRPRIFMRLDRGSHIDMKNKLGGRRDA